MSLGLSSSVRRSVLIALVVAGCASSSDNESLPTAVPPVTEPSTTAAATESTTTPNAPPRSSPATEVVLRRPVDSSELAIPILAMERECASGLRGDDRIAVSVRESPKDVVVSVSFRIAGDDQSCPENPWTPTVVELDTALGDRNLVGVEEQPRETHLPSDLAYAPGLGRTPPEGFVPTLVDGRFDSVGEVRCEDVGATELIAPQFGGAVFGDRDDLLAGLLESIGEPYAGFFATETPLGSSEFAQYLDGVLVASVSVRRTSGGWSGAAARCTGLPPGWSADTEPTMAVDASPEGIRVEPAGDDTLARLPTLLAAADGVEADDGRLRFASAADRCRSIVSMEDLLESNGWWIHGRLAEIDPPVPLIAGTFELPAQQRLLLVDDEHETAELVTHADGMIEIGPGGVGRLRWRLESFLEPCSADHVIAVTIR